MSNLTDSQLKDRLISQSSAKATKAAGFPTEIIDLPSKGLLYVEGHPLRCGTIEMKYMTAKEEDILASQSLVKRGLALDKLFKALIVGSGEGEPFEYDDLIVGDKNAVMVAARVLGYGKDYPISVEIPDLDLDEPHSMVVDLTQLKDVEFDETVFANGNCIDFKLPTSGLDITFKIMTSRDERSIQAEVLRQKKNTKGGLLVSRELSTRLKYIITSIDGDDSNKAIRDFVDTTMLSQDSLALRKYMAKVQPDVDLTIAIDLPEFDYYSEIPLPIGLDFFWPGS